MNTCEICGSTVGCLHYHHNKKVCFQCLKQIEAKE